MNPQNTVTSNKLKYSLTKITYLELLADKEIKPSLPLIERRFSKHSPQSIYSRSATEVAEGLTIFTDEINRIVIDDVITWTFQTESPVLETSDFENFLVKKHNGVFTYFLVSYEFTDLTDSETLYEKATSYLISEEYLSLEGLNLSSRDVFDWVFPNGGGGTGSGPCDGILVYGHCNLGGNADGHWPVLQNDGFTYCSGSPLLYIDFSHCENYGVPDPPVGDPPGGDDGSGGDQLIGGGGSGGGSSGGDGDTTLTAPVELADPRCPEGSGKVMVDGVCVCPEGKIENENGVCVCPEGYKANGRGDCIKEGHCFELDSMMSATSSSNPYILNGSANDPTGENTHLRIAIINMRDHLDSNWEHGYAFYNRGNFPQYGPYAHHYPTQMQNHVYLPGRAYQFGSIHTHPVNDVAIPMFSHDDMYSLLKIRNTYVNLGSTLLNDNNPAGDDLFLNILVVKQGADAQVYAIKISDVSKLRALEAIHQNSEKWDRYGKKLSKEYTDSANL
ncbi:MAG: hypothetical protein GKR88_10650 [Flavobacteriaceae bacterium]|nr:MAG: hypothetical protein GKR88_10650 [Flavobacteriaceae bacterium]